jgi:Glycosyl hydrolase family 26
MSNGAGRHQREMAGPRGRRVRNSAIAVVLVAGLAAAGASVLGGRASGDQCTVSATLVPSCGAWWGMYLPVDDDSQLPPAVQSEEHYLGRPLDIVERYPDMSVSDNGVFPDQAEEQIAGDRYLLFSWAADVWSKHILYKWRTIASGALDRSIIEPEAQRIAAFHHTVFLSFSAEPDGDVPQQGTPAQFVAAWRHIHDVFARMGVHNVIWVWTTEGYLPHERTIAAMYPGNAYVDWIGYDPYNYYTCHQAKWLSFAQTVKPFYQWLTTQPFGDKPVMLAEYGSAADPHQPDREAAWYRGLLPVIRQMPRLKALIQWNSAIPGCHLGVPRNSPEARAYRQAGLSSYLLKETP